MSKLVKEGGLANKGFILVEGAQFDILYDSALYVLVLAPRGSSASTTLAQLGALFDLGYQLCGILPNSTVADRDRAVLMKWRAARMRMAESQGIVEGISAPHDDMIP